MLAYFHVFLLSKKCMELILVHLIYSYLIRLESYQNTVLTNKSHLLNILFILVDGIKMSQTESTDKNQHSNLIRCYRSVNFGVSFLVS